MYVSPTYVISSDASIPSFKEVLGDLGIPYKYQNNNHVLTIADKFEILFRSGDQPERIVGANLGFALIDEPALQSEEVFKRVLARVRDPKARRRQLALAGTPEGLNWFFELSKDPNVHVIRAKTKDNFFLPPEYLSGLLDRYTPEEIRAYTEGEFVSFDGAWFRTLPEVAPFTMKSGVHLYKTPEQVSRQLVMGVDTGGGLGRDSSAFALVDRRDWSLVASWKNAEATIDQMAHLVRQVVALYTPNDKSYWELEADKEGPSPKVVVEANGIGRAAVQSLRSLGVSVIEQNTTDSNRYEGMQLVRQRIEEARLTGSLELREEAEKLVTKKGKFEGPKDLAMAIGFAYRYVHSHPYVAPSTERAKNVFTLQGRLGKRKGKW
jgi:hypothetical protein